MSRRDEAILNKCARYSWDNLLYVEAHGINDRFVARAGARIPRMSAYQLSGTFGATEFESDDEYLPWQSLGGLYELVE